MSRYTRTNNFPAGQKARGSAVQAELDAIQQWSEDMPDSDNVWSGNVNYAAAAGTANAITVAAPNTWTTYVGKDGYKLSLKISADNTGAVTVSVDGLSAKAVVRTDGAALQAGDLKQNGFYDFTYNESQEKFYVSAFNGLVVAAAASAAAASSSAGTASSAASAASSSAGAASSSASAASLSATLAMDWASKTDGPVAGSEYSAKYWALQAAAIVQIPAAGIVTSNGTTWGTSLTAPDGDLVGTTATQTLTNKTAEGVMLNKGYTEEVFAVTGTTPALSPTNGSIQTWTLSGNSTPTAGTWASGQSITLMVDDGTAYAITWTTLAVTWKTEDGAAPTLNTSGETAIQLWKVGTTIYGARVGNA